MSRWLKRNGITTLEASDWNQLTSLLSENIPLMRPITSSMIDGGSEVSGVGTAALLGINASIFIVVIDITLLDLRTDIWKARLNLLSKYRDKANFAWLLNHDTSNLVKIELRRQGHVLTVNKPLYQDKMTQIFEAVMKRRVSDPNNHQNAENTTEVEEGLQQSFEIEYAHSDVGSSDGSEKSDQSKDGLDDGRKLFKMLRNIENRYPIVRNRSVEKEETKTTDDVQEGIEMETTLVNKQKPLQGLHILLAEDTLVLQRVATIMLEKMGATINVVEDGLQAVNAFKSATEIMEQEGMEKQRTNLLSMPPYDLILMDCQVRLTS